MAKVLRYNRSKEGVDFQASISKAVIEAGYWPTVLCYPGVAAFAWVASQSARPLHQESGAVLSRSKTGSLIAEYKAVIAALRWLERTESIPGAWVEIRSDCAAVVDRLLGRCTIRSIAGIDALHQTADELRSALEARGCEVRLWHVPRNVVNEADRLCRRVYGNGVDLVTGPSDERGRLGDLILPYFGGSASSFSALP